METSHSAARGIVDDDLPLDDSEEVQLEWEQVQAEWIATGFPGCEPAFPVAKDQPRAVDEGFVIVEPDEVKTKAQPSTGRKEVWTYTAVVLVAGLRYAFAEATAEGLWLQVSARCSSWGFSAARGCWSWATVPHGFEPGSRAWGFLSKR